MHAHQPSRQDNADTTLLSAPHGPEYINDDDILSVAYGSSTVGGGESDANGGYHRLNGNGHTNGSGNGHAPFERRKSSLLRTIVGEEKQESPRVLLLTPLLVLLVLALIAFNLWAFVYYRVPLIRVDYDDTTGLFFEIATVVAASMCLICYFRAMFTSSYAADNVPTSQSIEMSEYPVCHYCESVKPARTHHCSICDKCVLKMDHHCPFVANCIGFHNYKFFFLFLFWLVTAALLMIVGNLVDASRIISLPSTSAQDVVLLIHFWTVVLFTLLMVAFTSFHVFLLFSGQTTLEYVLGIVPIDTSSQFQNFIAVFGSNPLTWLLPLRASDATGYEPPVRRVDSAEKLSYASDSKPNNVRVDTLNGGKNSYEPPQSVEKPQAL